MFTPIDKNLLIAAMESAIYHACVTANIVSLHAIETGVSSLRQRFDIDPASVSDAEVYGMVDTIERATIPKLTQISELDNTTNIADRVVSFRWKHIIEKPTTFPPSAHAHLWNEISSKPTTFPPSAHTHEAQPVAVTWADVSDKPTTFPPAEHTHEAQPVAVAWTDITDKPTTFPPAEHTHPEYAGGGAANGGQWTLRLNGSPLNYTQLPPTIWTGPRLIIKIVGTLLMAEDAWMLRIDEEGGLLAGILVSPSGNVTAYTGLGNSTGVSCSGAAITAVLDITPTQMTLTVNGLSASTDISKTYTESLLTIQIQQLLDISSVCIWTGDPATTAPLVLADASHIEHNVLINQAARHIGTGEYDLTLNAPVVLYR